MALQHFRIIIIDAAKNNRRLRKQLLPMLQQKLKRRVIGRKNQIKGLFPFVFIYIFEQWKVSLLFDIHTVHVLYTQLNMLTLPQQDRGGSVHNTARPFIALPIGV